MAPNAHSPSATASGRVTGVPSSIDRDRDVRPLQRDQRRDEAEVPHVQPAQQAEEGEEVQGAGERRQPGTLPLAARRSPSTRSATGRMTTTPVASTQKHLRQRSRLPRHPLREHVAGRVRERGQQACEDGEHAASLSEAPRQRQRAGPRASLAPIGPAGEDGVMETSPQLPVAADWFSLTWVTGADGGAHRAAHRRSARASLWYFRGRDRDLLVDTGNGVAPRRPLLARLARGGRPRSRLRGHARPRRPRRRLPRVRPAAAAPRRAGARRARSATSAPLATALWSEEMKAQLAGSGFIPPPVLVGRCPRRASIPWRSAPCPPHRPISSAARRVDLGDRRLTIVDLPGHTPGGIGLLDHEERALLSGDAIYEGGLIDTLPESDVEAYLGDDGSLR